MDTIATLPPVGLNIVVLLVVILLKSLITRLSSNSHLSFFHFYCQQLANKVNKPSNSAGQRKVAGFIACLITIVPVLLILWIFEYYVELNIVWHAFLLYFAFGSFGHSRAVKNIRTYSEQQLKEDAREALSPWVLRDVKKLSLMGINKASIEMLQIRFLQHQFSIACYFLLLGPYVAITTRMLIDMHHCWNTKKNAFQYFGLFAQWSVQSLMWLPTRLYTLVLSVANLARPVFLSNKVPNHLMFSTNNNIALAAMASILDIRLGGVAMYDEEKQRATEFNQSANAPSAIDIDRAIGQLNSVKILTVGVLLGVIVILVIIK